MTGRNPLRWPFWCGLAAFPAAAGAAPPPAMPADCPSERPAEPGASEAARQRGAYKEALAAAETAVAQAAPRRAADPAAHANAVVQRALSLSELNRFAEALPQVEAAAATLVRLKGPRHADAIAARIALAAIQADSGRTLKAEALLRVLIADMAAIRCPDRERLAEGQLALAGSLPEEKIAEARRLAAAGLAARTSVHGERHWKTAQAEIVAARLLRTPAGFEEAAAILERALDKLAALDRNDIRLLSARGALASNLASRQRQAEGAEVAREAWIRARAAYGESAPITLSLAQGLAVALIGSGRADDADPVLTAALRTATHHFGESHPRTTGLLFVSALMRNAQKKYEQAEQDARRFNAWAHRTYGPNHSHTVYGTNALAIIQYAADKKWDAAKTYLDVYRMASATFAKDDPFFVDLLPSLAYTLAEINLPAESLRFYDLAHSTQKQSLGEGDPRTLLTACRLGHLAANQRQPDRAIALLSSAAELARQLPPADATRRECLQKYAEMLVAKGEPDRARQVLMQEYFPAGLDPSKLVAADLMPVYLLAMIARAKQAPEDVDRLLKMALPLAVAASDEQPLYAFRVTVTYIEFLSQFHRSAEIHQIANGPFVDLWTKAKNVHFLTAFEIFMSVAPNLTVLYSDDRESMTALRTMFQSGLTDLKDLLPQHPELHDQLLESLMIAASYLDDLPETERLATELHARRLAAFGPSDARTVVASWRVGSARLTSGKYAEAEQAFRQVEAHLDTVAGGAGNIGAIELRRSLLGALLKLPGREAEALGLARKVVADVRAWRVANNQDRSRFARFLGMAATEEVVFPSLADADWAMGQVAPAESKALESEAWDALQRSLAGPASRAIAIAAARAAAERHGSGLGNLARERDALLDRWRSSEAKLAEALLTDSGARARTELEAGKRATEDRLEKVDAELRRRFRDYYALIEPEPMALADVREMLAPDEAALLAVPSNGGTHVMVVTRDDLRWRLVDLQYPDLMARVARLRADLEADVQDCREPAAAAPAEATVARRCGTFDRTTAWSLYLQLVAPFEDLLKGKRHVFVAASGPLASIPFGIFVTEAPRGDDWDPAALRATPWLAERYALVDIPSLQSLRLLRESNRSKRGAPGRSRRFAGYGDPLLFGPPSNRRGPSAAPELKPAALTGTDAAVADVLTVRDLPRLPGTASELIDLGHALGAPDSSIRLRKEATEAAVRTADLSSTRVIAFATHGLIPWQIDGVAEPALVFTPPAAPSGTDDGLLTASEITGMRLQAEWVILSACNTAAGQFQGAPVLSGLARAFLFAGARSLLVSHWPVRDDVAAELTADAILRQKRSRGMSRAEALQAAMRAIRNSTTDDSRAHPAAWAPFALVGDVR